MKAQFDEDDLKLIVSALEGKFKELEDKIISRIETLNPANSTLISVDVAANQIQVKRQTVYKWIKAKKFPVMYIGEKIRIKQSDFNSYISQGHKYKL